MTWGLLQQTVLFAEDDRRYLRMAGEVLADQVEALLDVRYGFVGSHPTWCATSRLPAKSRPGRVRPRFEPWVRDLCHRDYDQAWLDYQHEIALRHTPAKKNATDESTRSSSCGNPLMIVLVSGGTE
jgi:Protoglobin